MNGKQAILLRIPFVPFKLGLLTLYFMAYIEQSMSCGALKCSQCMWHNALNRQANRLSDSWFID